MEGGGVFADQAACCARFPLAEIGFCTVASGCMLVKTKSDRTDRTRREGGGLLQEASGK